MKLKALIKKAKARNLKWVSVDNDGHAYATTIEPVLSSNKIIQDSKFGGWEMPKAQADYFLLLGRYTGKKHWKDTLRKVK